MTRSRTLRLAVAAAATAVGAVLAAPPALADPYQVCVVYDEDRHGVCVQIGIPLDGSVPLPR